MAKDTSKAPETTEDVELDITDDGGASTDGKGGYMSGQSTTPGTGGTTGTGTGSSS